MSVVKLPVGGLVSYCVGLQELLSVVPDELISTPVTNIIVIGFNAIAKEWQLQSLREDSSFAVVGVLEHVKKYLLDNCEYVE